MSVFGPLRVMLTLVTTRSLRTKVPTLGISPLHFGPASLATKCKQLYSVAHLCPFSPLPALLQRTFVPIPDLWSSAGWEVMFEVRFHGRGGQGAVTAADLLALAAFEEGRHAQSFPSFGSERTGAPVVAYCRLSEQDIRTREPVVAPDCVVVIDPTLVHQVDLFAGLSPDGFVLINSAQTLDLLGLGSLQDEFDAAHLVTTPATEVALRQVGRPLPNAALVGGFAALTARVSIGAVSAAIRKRFRNDPSIAERNVAAATEVYRNARQAMVLSGEGVLGAPAD
jgi:pyruvate ferredoxin oxidoreductase gamma subunit